LFFHRRKHIGVVTSAMWSPAAKASIALASVTMPWGRPDDELYAEIYYQKELKWNRFMARCRVVDGAFYDPVRRRLTPAPDL
jgi:aminomethyltransferase